MGWNNTGGRVMKKNIIVTAINDYCKETYFYVKSKASCINCISCYYSLLWFGDNYEVNYDNQLQVETNSSGGLLGCNNMFKW